MTEFDHALVREVQARIRDVPDFPKKGIVFKDLTPVLAHGPTLRAVMQAFADRYRSMKLDLVAAIEARGFVLGAPIAAELGVGLALLRKPGKLPWNKVRQSYDLEYGSDALEMHEDAIHPGARLIVVDDLLATGGTMRAAVDLVRSRGGEIVETAFLVELGFLGGRGRLGEVPVTALVRY
jgi:adenine phosphoribosyltransferase